MDAVLWIIAIVVGLIVVVAILAVAVRGMRPKLPEPQVFTPTTATSHSAAASSATTSASGLTPDVIAEIDRLVAAGQKIHAIKLYRDHSGTGLKEAKDRIDHWSVSTTAPHTAAVSNTTATHSAITPTAATPSSVRAQLPASVASDIDKLVAGGAKIAAIKALREHTGLGLKESKDLIEAWPHTHAS
ncbi:ribosomal protein L7/L12 [Microbacterium sp. NPDC091662]|uniref:ribosomal protein L7/L12 n=1 Tax=Microbacterium sp. NPDC091662 TaxID=3364211 RepID=UPI00381FC25B